MNQLREARSAACRKCQCDSNDDVSPSFSERQGAQCPLSLRIWQIIRHGGSPHTLCLTNARTTSVGGTPSDLAEEGLDAVSVCVTASGVSAPQRNRAPIRSRRLLIYDKIGCWDLNLASLAKSRQQTNSVAALYWR